MTLDLNLIRPQFAALDRPQVFFDNPGGTQIVQSSLERIVRYFKECNANHGGEFATSRASDVVVDAAREAMADFINARSGNEIIFGPNMTTLTFSMSRALGRTFNPGDTIVVTRMDHDANISPWLMMAEERGLKVRWVDFHPEDGTLNLEDFQAALEEKPRLVAFGYASNLLGTINPVEKMTRMAHEAGALVYLDAVQYVPHAPVDVQRVGCDFTGHTWGFFTDVMIYWKAFGLIRCVLRRMNRRENSRPVQEILSILQACWEPWSILSGLDAPLVRSNMSFMLKIIRGAG
jgi:selenocysteine lyase/cysteine desulfurase